MAKLIDFGGSVDSNLVEGLGTNSVTFTMPGNVGLAVESVLATVNNSGGAATTGLLTVRDQSGQVIAKQRQGETIDAAVNGTATWALRLAASGASRTAPVWSRYRGVQNIPVNPASGSLDWINIDGTVLLDLTNPLIPTVLRTGTYLMSMSVETVGVTAGAFYYASFQTALYQAGNASTAINTTVNAAQNAVNIALMEPLTVGDFVRVDVWHDQAAAQNFNHITDIIYIP